MSFGKLYSNPANSRTVGLLSIAKENNLDVEVVNTETGANYSDEAAALNPQRKIPIFVQNDFVLTESLAIAIYFTSQNEKTTLLGKSKQEYAQILRWMSFGTGEVLPTLGSWFRPLLGLDQYNKKNVDVASQNVLLLVGILEKHLLTKTYLVGERPTVADYFLAGTVHKGFQYVFDKEFRDKFPNFSRWYSTIANQPSWAGKFELIDEAIKYTPPAKAEKPAKAPKAPAAPAPKKKEPEPEEEEDEAPPAPKPKHPIEALGRATLVLDDWKRKYSNDDTRTSALPWFWENYNPEEWSLWRIDYKYNDELKKIFMSSNLIGGFFNRLEASRKYIFGSASVYGKEGDSFIQGAFFIRGQDHKAAFDVAPDWESYEFTKLDHTNEADKEFVENEWAWDKPVTRGENTYEHADGKVFK